MDELATVADRILWLEKEYFGGRRKFARKIQCSHVTISHLASGRNQPSDTLTRKIVKNLGVRSEWLLHGEGTVFSHPNAITGADPRLIPIAKQLLPGLPAEHRQLLAPTAFPSQWPFFTEDLYAIRVKDCMLGFPPSKEYLRSDDLLFIASRGTTSIRESALVVRGSVEGFQLVRTADIESLGKGEKRAETKTRVGRLPRRTDFGGDSPKRSSKQNGGSEVVGVVVQLVRAF